MYFCEFVRKSSCKCCTRNVREGLIRADLGELDSCYAHLGVANGVSMTVNQDDICAIPGHLVQSDTPQCTLHNVWDTSCVQVEARPQQRLARTPGGWARQEMRLLMSGVDVGYTGFRELRVE